MAQNKEAREQLKAISRAVKPLVSQGAFDSVNAAIVNIYKQQGHEILKTFWQWKSEGKSVKKGEKALPVWASPKKVRKDEAPNIDKDFDFYPICYLFSNKQVA